MKISITPSHPEDSLQHIVIVEDIRDDLNAKEIVELFRYAMLGMGFTDTTLEEVLPTHTETIN